MTQQTIGVGSTPNDGTGDTLREAFTKVNDNFTDLYTNYQTTTGLAANVATLTSNNTNFVGSVSAANVVSNAQLIANLSSYANISSLSDYQTTAGLAANIATLTSNLASYIVANDGIVSNSSGVFVSQGTGTVVNSTGVHVNSSYIATLAANSANYVNANNGVISNSSGVFFNGNTGLVVNATGVYVNSSYIATLAANSAAYINANSGIISNTTGVYVNTSYIETLTANLANYIVANNGLLSNATGVYVYGNTGLVVNATGVHINSDHVATLTGIQTLTNKRIQPRALSITIDASTYTVNTDVYDTVVVTGQSVNITSFSTTGTPVNAQRFWIALTANSGTPSVTWSSNFESSSYTTLPSSISTSRIDVNFIWNAATSKWRCVGIL